MFFNYRLSAAGWLNHQVKAFQVLLEHMEFIVWKSFSPSRQRLAIRNDNITIKQSRPYLHKYMSQQRVHHFIPLILCLYLIDCIQTFTIWALSKSEAKTSWSRLVVVTSSSPMP